MEDGKKYIDEERISLSYLIKRLIFWVNFVFSKWLKICLGAIVCMLLVTAYNYLKPRVYTAKTTFVLENESSGGLGELGSLASLAGVNLGGLSEGSVLFQIDNIQQLYQSNRMLRKTLLSPIGLDGEIVLEHFARATKLDKDWKREGVELADFRTTENRLTRKQDSLVFESMDLIREEFLIVAKPNRKTTILEVGFSHRDEVLAKRFTEIHVRNVNQFYKETRTKKTAANLKVLQLQADSVKKVLDESIYNLAQADERMPNPNPLYKTSQVPYQKAMIDVQANGAIYQEIVKQLELAKVAQRNQMPLIQVIDEPRYPLPNNKWKLFKTIFIGVALGAVIMIMYLFISQVIKSALKETT